MEISFLMGRRKKTPALVSNEFMDGQCFAKSYYVTESILSLPSDIQLPQLQGVSKQQTENEKGATTQRAARAYGAPRWCQGGPGGDSESWAKCVFSLLYREKENFIAQALSMWPLQHVFVPFLKTFSGKLYFICLDLCILRVFLKGLRALLVVQRSKRVDFLP